MKSLSSAVTLLCLVALHLVDHNNADKLDKIQLNSQGQFVDAAGRIRLFRGINSVLKSPPWYTEDSLDPRHMKYYQEWGFNFVRLGCMWTGFYPRRANEVNTSYVDILQQSVDMYADHGMYVLLDMHQDVISSKVDGYDGVPRWLVDSFPELPKELQFPWPLKHPGEGSRWYENYLAYETGEIFQNLYSNVSSSWDHWATFWKKVAEVFGKKNSVMGFELINEPWAGNVYRNPLRILPGYAGRHNLLPLYDYLVKEIRSVDPSTLVFYEPLTWGYYLPGGGYQGTGFDHLPGGGTENPARTVFSYHYYCWLLQNADAEQPYPHWEQAVCDHIFVQQLIRTVLTDQKQFKDGLFLTEFGLCAPDNSSESINTIECRVMLDLLDLHLQNWAYWDSQFFNATTDEPHWLQVKYFARSYPRAIAGEPQSLSFNHTTGEMKFQFLLNTTLTAPTEIFLPLKIHYGGSAKNVRIEVKPEGILRSTVIEEQNSLILEKISDYQENQSEMQLMEVKVTRNK